jgi:hypothetical protein
MPFKAKERFKAWRNIWQITHFSTTVLFQNHFPEGNVIGVWQSLTTKRLPG